MSSDRYQCARCHYFFHELDMTKVDDGRLMCGDCAAIEHADTAQAKEPETRWICSQCKYESSWQFARCGSCGCHGSCLDKKFPPPPFEDGMKDGCQCADCGNYYPLVNIHETSTGKLICKKCFEKYKVAMPKEEVASSYFDPMDVAGLCPSRLGVNAPSGTSNTGYRLCCACGKMVLVSGLLYMDASNPYMCIECCNKADPPVPKREMCCDCGVAEVDPPPRCGVCWSKDFQDRYEKRNENKKQPDNSHYTKGGIEPWTYIQANSLNFFEGSVVKYITRWRHKNGIEDLRKARVYIDELIQQEESK